MERKTAKEAQILVIVKEPGKAPRVEPLFDNTLEAFQAAVGGYIETVTLAANLVLICNEEGRIRGLPYNCSVDSCPFFGTVLVVGVKRDEFASLKASVVPSALAWLREEAIP
jgi:hypothetical protein